jgi:hypothetical protein
VDPVPDPLLLRKSGSANNRTWTSGSVGRNSDHWTTEAVFNQENIYKKERAVLNILDIALGFITIEEPGPELAGVQIRAVIRIQKVLGSNLGRTPAILVGVYRVSPLSHNHFLSYPHQFIIICHHTIKVQVKSSRA